MSEHVITAVRPDVAYLEEILLQCDQGDIRVPRFQRPFEWKPKQMTDLFDSIASGYPIGSLLFWETREHIGTLNHIGPISVQSQQRSQQVSYVLDGHQRLSTLLGVLRLPQSFPRDPEDSWRWWIWYDLRTGSFHQLRYGQPEPHWLPLRSVLKTIDFLAECRRIQGACFGEAERLIAEAERFAQRIKNYRVPFTVVRGDMSQAIQTFSRLNSTGRRISEDQMLSALTYREGDQHFHLDSEIDEILESLSAYHFQGISRTTVFRAILAGLQTDVYKSDLEGLVRKSSRDLPRVVSEVSESLRKGVEFLRTRAGVISYRLLPYEPQLVMLSEFFRNSKSSRRESEDVLLNWFWHSSFTAWFAGASDSDLNEVLVGFRDFALHQNPRVLRAAMLKVPARPFPSNFNLRSARVRTCILYLLTLKPRSLVDGSLLDAEELINSDGPNAFGYIDPRYRSRFVNRIFSGAKLRKDAMQALRGGAIDDTVLRSQGLNEGCLFLYRIGNVDGFLHQRERILAEGEKEFMDAHGILPPQTESGFDQTDTDLEVDT